MSVPLDLITQRNLILVKQIYQRAVVQSASQHSDVDRILSLISFDLANETLLKNAVSAVDSKVDIPSDLSKLIQTADRVFVASTPPIPPVPDSQKVKRVRRISNGAMHEAKYPTASDISDCRTYTRDFLQQLFLNVWDTDFDSISLTDLITNARAKTFLQQAEVEFEKGETTDAALQAMAGLEPMLEKAITAVVGLTPFFTGTTARNEDVNLTGVWWAFESITKTIALPIIGLDYPTYLKYKSLTSNLQVHHFADGGIDTNISGPEPSADDAEFIVRYAVNSVLQIESIVGDIDKPFGGHLSGTRWLF